MKRIIKGKLYDTDTAAEVATVESSGRSQLDYFEETLYRKRTGEYFLYGYGHAASKYAESMGDGVFGAGEDIIPLTYGAARDWAERSLDADDYMREFGEPEDGSGDEPSHIHVTVSEAARRALEDECRTTGESRSSVVERLLLGLRR